MLWGHSQPTWGLGLNTTVLHYTLLTLLSATQGASQSLSIPLISMSMGPYGSLSRMVGFVYGSALTWAVGKSSSAPGQVRGQGLGRVRVQARWCSAVRSA